MKQLLVGAALLITAAIGISAPSPTPSPSTPSHLQARPERLRHGSETVTRTRASCSTTGRSAAGADALGIGVPGAGTIGDDETPDSVRTVDVGAGRTVTEVDGGQGFTCALLDNGDVRCWGAQTFGPVLGSPESGGQRIGDSEEPTTIAPIALGGKATAIASGNFSSCAILEDGSVRCWGDNGQGQLGYGNTNDVGDDETPASVGPVSTSAPGGQATADHRRPLPRVRDPRHRRRALLGRRQRNAGLQR